MYKYVKNEGDKAVTILKERFDFQAWQTLSECTLILIQIFNRRRAGDTEALTLIDFIEQDKVGKNISADLFNKLSKPSQAIAKKFVRVSGRGKLGRPVSILVHSYILEYVELIKKYRLETGVKSSNEYLFGRPNTNPLQIPYLKACPIMRKFASACGAKVPASLRGTTLRMHVATYTAMIGIEDTDVERLASFMGHHKDIHKNIYRMPIPLTEMTKVAHLLEVAMDQDDEENSDSSSEKEDKLDDGASGSQTVNLTLNNKEDNHSNLLHNKKSTTSRKRNHQTSTNKKSNEIIKSKKRRHQEPEDEDKNMTSPSSSSEISLNKSKRIIVKDAFNSKKQKSKLMYVFFFFFFTIIERLIEF